MNKLITRDDVMTEHKNGAHEILMDAHTVITDWAKEIAESYGIKFVREFTKTANKAGKFIIAANWKMNFTLDEALALAAQLKNIDFNSSREMILCPPFLYLSTIKNLIRGTNIRLGAQNMFFQEAGAWTGEISAKMLKSIDIDYVIIGHSERRHIFKETDEEINKKILKALEYGLKPIFCVGETLVERKRYAQFNVIKQQLEKGLKNAGQSEINDIIIAYEPVWAIGTGLTAKPEDAQQIHEFIRRIISQIFDKNSSLSIKVIYGGSVKPGNIDLLMQQRDIDGVLVGGASLKYDEFKRIYEFRIT